MCAVLKTTEFVIILLFSTKSKYNILIIVYNVSLPIFYEIPLCLREYTSYDFNFEFVKICFMTHKGAIAW